MFLYCPLITTFRGRVGLLEKSSTLDKAVLGKSQGLASGKPQICQGSTYYTKYACGFPRRLPCLQPFLAFVRCNIISCVCISKTCQTRAATDDAIEAS